MGASLMGQQLVRTQQGCALVALNRIVFASRSLVRKILTAGSPFPFLASVTTERAFSLMPFSANCAASQHYSSHDVLSKFAINQKIEVGHIDQIRFTWRIIGIS